MDILDINYDINPNINSNINPNNSNTLSTSCGIFAINVAEPQDIIDSVVNGIYKLQHRGQESCGISYSNFDTLHANVGMGLVKNVFSDIIDEKGNINKNNKNFISTNMCVGHVRYSTSRCSNKKRECQPLCNGQIAIAHNGNVHQNYLKRINANSYDNDTSAILKFISLHDTIFEGLQELIKKVPSAFCIVVITNKKMYVARDKHGVRPLLICKGKFSKFSKLDEIGKVNCIYVSSETCALPDNSITDIREIQQGEIIEIKNAKITREWIYTNTEDNRDTSAFCIFEFVYFLRRNSTFNNAYAEDFRVNCGKKLAQIDSEWLKDYIKNDNIIDKDYITDTIVIGSPNSGIDAGIGYSIESGLQYKQYIEKMHDVRTFIISKQSERENACYKKYNINPEINGKSVIIVDDSIVRGTTIKVLIEMLREAGAKKVHIRIASPPIMNPCYFGIDIPSTEELVANRCNDICEEIGADTLVYIPVNAMVEALNECGMTKGVCTGCFDNDYKGMIDW
jgi:amidophosphoribosyltransferase